MSLSSDLTCRIFCFCSVKTEDFSAVTGKPMEVEWGLIMWGPDLEEEEEHMMSQARDLPTYFTYDPLFRNSSGFWKSTFFKHKMLPNCLCCCFVHPEIILVTLPSRGSPRRWTHHCLMLSAAHSLTVQGFIQGPLHPWEDTVLTALKGGYVTGDLLCVCPHTSTLRLSPT